MGIDRKILFVSVALLSLSSFSDQSAAGISEETIRALDPSRAALRLCGRARNIQGSAPAWLTVARLATTAQGATGILPFVPGVIDLGFKISTHNPLAQRYFNQGLLLSYGFNETGAVRAFREAQRLDPGCAMCWWGEALVQGPNINAAMDPGRNSQVMVTVAQAQKLASEATPVERALIDALAKRYSADPSSDRVSLDKAYADAMFKVASNFPKHDEAALLAAEAEMDLRPWDYWEADKKSPKGRTSDAVALVAAVLARRPDHPQAAHLYIHLLENAADPKQAEAAADRLASLDLSGAGHLVHMPSHLYYVLGRFKDSLRANIAAARADEAYLNRTQEQGYYRYSYYPHNVHFIITSAQMAGDGTTALRESERLKTLLDPKVTASQPWLQAVEAAPYLAAAQFDEPSTVLKQTPPVSGLPYVLGMWHYSRAVAFGRLRDQKSAETEIAEIERLRTTNDFKTMTDLLMPAPDILNLAATVARGKLAYNLGHYSEAITHFTEAAKVEGGIWYQEPPYWYYPVRQSLGAALYRAGDYQGARSAFQGALAQYPNNGWALFGLVKVYQALGDRPNEAAVTAAFRRSWLGRRGWLTVDRI
jgi:tetratricopeptide (TPR) repeat protein